ncbi:MAG: ATP-binding protein [Thermodesulfobacteriota bacterium]
MGYDILAKVIEVTDSSSALDRKLKKTARLVLESFPFDSCALYLREGRQRRFTLKVAEGDMKGLVRSYGGRSGIAGLAGEKRVLVEAYTPSIETTLWKGVRDDALEGFRAAVVYPIGNGGKLYGLIYLRARRQPSLTPRKRKLLGLIALQLSSLLKGEENSRGVRDACLKLRECKIRLVNAEKLMSLGELSATLAHEIKNPLLSLGGFALRLRKKIEPDSPHMPYVEQIQKEVARLEDIMDGILGFSEERKIRFEREDLNTVAEDAIAFFTEACRSHSIRVKKKFCKGPLPVMADCQQLRIAFDNLIANAIQSMEGGGTLSVETSRRRGLAVAEVTDNGGGIDLEIMENIFNPFFTTKESGTGLGLAITHKIVTRHNGSIDVKNVEGEGVTFSVKLPCGYGATDRS